MTKSLISTLLIVFGIISVGMFYTDFYFPVWMSVAVMVFVSLYFLESYRHNQMGILLLLLWLVYALPFIHIPPYIWFDFSQDPLKLWGLRTNPYMTDQHVIELTAMIGAVGAIGMALGVSLSTKPIQHNVNLNFGGKRRILQTMVLPMWLFWVGIGLMLTWLSAPQETLLTSAYTKSVSLIAGFNFSSAWMVSYVILTFAFCDALLTRKGNIKRFKMIVISVVIWVVVVYFQLLRGNRESVPWVFGMVLAYFYWAVNITKRSAFNIPWFRIGGVAFVLVAVSMVFGVMRHSLVGASLSEVIDLFIYFKLSGSIGLQSMLHGTWSAVLLTPLSVAGDHVNGLLSLKFGKDYLNLFLSIIPGFIADAVGYIRPIDANQGPAWEMRYGLGGTHAVVLPFMNFSMIGVFLIPALWSFIMTLVEKAALKKINVIYLSFLVTMVMAAPHWLWYGEKNGINAIVIWLIFAIFYRISLSLFHLKNIDSSRFQAIKTC